MLPPNVRKTRLLLSLADLVMSDWSWMSLADSLPHSGFTTFSVVNNARRLIAYPAYTDKEVQGGNTVSPNRSYPVQNIPK